MLEGNIEITVGGRHAANPREAAISPPTQASPLKAPHRTATISGGRSILQVLSVRVRETPRGFLDLASPAERTCAVLEFATSG